MKLCVRLACAQHLLTGVAAVLAVFAGLPAGAAPKTELNAIVIGQSLPTSGAWFGTATTIRAGTEAAVQAVNAAGGINGRQIELVTLDDQGVAARYTANIQRLVSQNKAVAILNCVGDASCRAANLLAIQLKVPLVGVIAGTAPPPGRRSLYSVRLRPTYEQESRALTQQLESMQIRSVALVGVAGEDDEQVRTFAAALTKSGIKSSRYTLEGKGQTAYDRLLDSMVKGNHQAVFLDVNPGVVDDMEASKVGARREWPWLVLAQASPSTTQLALLMKPRIVGYTSVVPNPDRSSRLIVQQFQHDVDNYATPDALRFEGLEAYINTRLLIEALRKTRDPVNAERLATTLYSMGSIYLGGFQLDLDPARAFASDYIELGVTSKDGFFLR